MFSLLNKNHSSNINPTVCSFINFFIFVFHRITRLERVLSQKKQLIDDLRDKIKEIRSTTTREKELLVGSFLYLSRIPCKTGTPPSLNCLITQRIARSIFCDVCQWTS